MTLSDPAALAIPLLALLVGLAAGWAHFASLRYVTGLLAAGRLSAVMLQMVRLALLAGLLVLFARNGAPTLLFGAAGILAGRYWVLRRTR
ncbi:hypothetical protein GCM10011321_09460 [Youhaiella tibetensis]|uniref:Uncharacterized protein n=1 Tax=Paradevosia tibetensis TaxID=1447062 RepID=A0A5B9DQ80_9HYPH|nr:ATP synthase subunit I [Youhaiella tibetensis]QEE20899.1 hypothetical protein FNA67_12240 [Youhaiella tibetensis]GGF20069.1 hypothetical protein GCM10011321_09460 [Youhaiella tibetensis]